VSGETGHSITRAVYFTMSWLGQQQRSSKLRPATSELYSTSELSLYDQPPEAQVSIEDFEGFALDRLKGYIPRPPPCHKLLYTLL